MATIALFGVFASAGTLKVYAQNSRGQGSQNEPRSGAKALLLKAAERVRQ